MAKEFKTISEESLQEMLERIRRENEALQRLIHAMKDQFKPVENQILKKSNR